MAGKEGAVLANCRRKVAAECLNSDDTILPYTSFDHNVISNGSVFPPVDSMRSGAMEPDVYLLLLLYELN